MSLKFAESAIQQQRNYQMDQSDLTEAQRQRVKDIESLLDDLLDDYAKERHSILNDGDRSEQGRQKDLGTLKQAMAERLQRITDSEVKQIATTLAELEVQLRPQPPATDPAVQEMREQEIRTLLRDKPELSIMADYEIWATEGGADDSMRAVENAPTAFPLISDPAILEAGRAARAARHNPKAAALLKQLRQMQGLLRNSIASAEATIDLPADDWLARVAAGEITPD